jgi:hypothetical protein
LIQEKHILALAVLLSSCLPASAQTRPAQLSLLQEPSPQRMILLAAASSHPPLFAPPPVRPIAERPAPPAALLVVAYKRYRKPERLFQMETIQTPFVSQSSVTLVQLWGGRLQLRGFGSIHRMGAVLNGFSGPGVSRYLELRVPRARTSYGASLTFHLGRDAQR